MWSTAYRPFLEILDPVSTNGQPVMQLIPSASVGLVELGSTRVEAGGGVCDGDAVSMAG